MTPRVFITEAAGLAGDAGHPLLRWIDRGGAGLELGPSHRPLAPKAAAYNVKILDHLDRAGLIAKYTPHGVNVAAIEEVDYVWKGEPYRELVGPDVTFDWIIACHLIEHTPDLVGFLRNCESVLAPDGVLALAVPDKRYCFDRFRQKTSLGAIIDAHRAGRTAHTEGAAADYFMNVVKRGDSIAWEADAPGDYRCVHTREHALVAMKQISEGAYLDLHAWVFTPSSFRLIIEDLRALGLIGLGEVAFASTRGHEFYAVLGRGGAGPDIPRLELMMRADAETA